MAIRSSLASSNQTVAGPSPVSRACMVAPPGGMTNRDRSFRQPSTAVAVRPANIQSITFSFPSLSVTESVAFPVPWTRTHPVSS